MDRLVRKFGQLDRHLRNLRALESLLLPLAALLGVFPLAWMLRAPGLWWLQGGVMIWFAVMVGVVWCRIGALVLRLCRRRLLRRLTRDA